MRFTVLLVLAIAAPAQTDDVIPALKELQQRLGFDATGNFERRSDGRRAFYRCYYTGKLELPASYDGLHLKQGQETCGIDESRYDVFYYAAEAVANGSAPVTTSLAEASLERVLVVVPHEDFHQTREARQAPSPLDEGAATLAGFLTAAEFARERYGETSEIYQNLSREPELFLRKAEIVNRYHRRLSALYASARAGRISRESALVEKVRAFVEAQRECETIQPDPRSFHKCLSAPNNAGLAFDFTYTQQYPRFYAMYQANSRQVGPTLDALRRTPRARWWMDEPVRLVQTNLRETDAALDPARLVRQVAEFPANALLFGMGGITAYYPTRVEFHYPSPHVPPGGDLFGQIRRETRRRGIRLIGRFDLSKTQKAVYEAHPEWFFRRVNGEPVVYNGLYSTCINGGYYRGHALRILAEALERYDVDGLFFNMFGNPASDYSGNPLGPCHCENCRARYGRPLPASPNAEYRRFLAESAREVAAEIGKLIHAKRPQAAFWTYIQDHVDGIMSESNTAVDRPLPLWPYSASDNVNRARTSQPDKMAFNLCMGFVDIPYRFAIVPGPEIQLRLYQSMAHGAGPAFAALGTLDQDDRTGLAAARPVFEWHQQHQDLYVGQQSAARVLLLGGRSNSYRGLFRLLSEQHVPFAVSDNLNWIDARPFDLVLAPEGVPRALDAWLRRGGKLLATGATPPELDLPPVVRRWTNTRSAYWRLRNRALFPSLKDTDLLFLDGEYTELAPPAQPLLTLIPPSQFGPPEKVFTDKVETDKPGLLLTGYGSGRLAWLPWDIAGLYYRHSSPAHAGLLGDLIDHLLGSGRQLRTNAHPLVEITVMQQAAQHRTLVHFINLSGHSGTAYFAPLEMRDIEVELAAEFRTARAVRLGRSLPVTRSGRYGKFSLPRLEAYDVVVLQ